MNKQYHVGVAVYCAIQKSYFIKDFPVIPVTVFCKDGGECTQKCRHFSAENENKKISRNTFFFVTLK
jgi:hypothetical protein